MEGYHQTANVEERGIIPRAIEQIFGHIQQYASPRMRFLVRASYLQIYNEQISDLLKPERNNLSIREDKKKGVFVEGLSEWVVRSPAEIYGLMERGAQMRATGSTKMNEISSRSLRSPALPSLPPLLIVLLLLLLLLLNSSGLFFFV